ncbi:MAG TPA: nuclear transport factor 2 family protein [Candidatus Dormibacteraeota bacterium]|nr:nuclear transport factor 2 family protein [Candidatus Dormibacteraeota bacterium]
MANKLHELITSYIDAVGEGRFDEVRPMLEPDAEFIVGDTQLRGVDAFIGGFRRLAPIIKRNEIRKIFVDGDEACVIYDFVTDTAVGPVVSIEYLKFKNGRIASSLLVFERLHWPEVLAEMTKRAAT